LDQPLATNRSRRICADSSSWCRPARSRRPRGSLRAPARRYTRQVEPPGFRHRDAV